MLTPAETRAERVERVSNERGSSKGRIIGGISV
jgi:hypothetical protein